jgi:hypothetical protein
MSAMTDPEVAGIQAYRVSLQTLQERHSDAVTKITEGENQEHQLLMQLKRCHEFTEYHRRRKRALERRILTSREFIRAIEDDDMGIG